MNFWKKFFSIIPLLILIFIFGFIGSFPVIIGSIAPVSSSFSIISFVIMTVIIFSGSYVVGLINKEYWYLSVLVNWPNLMIFSTELVMLDVREVDMIDIWTILIGLVGLSLIALLGGYLGKSVMIKKEQKLQAQNLSNIEGGNNEQS